MKNLCLIIASVLPFLFSKQIYAKQLCGIELGQAFSASLSGLGDNKELETDFKKVLPHLKYYSSDEKGQLFTLLGEFKLDHSQVKKMGKNSMEELIPGALKGIKDSTPDGIFSSSGGQAYVDQSSRIELSFAYTLADDPNNYLESRTLLFQSSKCRIDAFHILVGSNKEYLNKYKNIFLDEIHAGGRGKLWIVPLKGEAAPMFNSHSIGKLVGKGIGVFIVFGLFSFFRRKKKIKS